MTEENAEEQERREISSHFVKYEFSDYGSDQETRASRGLGVPDYLFSPGCETWSQDGISNALDLLISGALHQSASDGSPHVDRGIFNEIGEG